MEGSLGCLRAVSDDLRDILGLGTSWVVLKRLGRSWVAFGRFQLNIAGPVPVLGRRKEPPTSTQNKIQIEDKNDDGLVLGPSWANLKTHLGENEAKHGCCTLLVLHPEKVARL